MVNLTLVAPASLLTWFEPLGGDSATMIPIGEGGPLAEDTVCTISDAAAGDVIRIHSGHDSLTRDLQLAKDLRKRGNLVYAQSATAVAAGLDKAFARTVMQNAVVPLTAWGLHHTPDSDNVLVKARNSTQSRSIRWGQADSPLEPDTYWEQWIDGIEYSVNGYREHGTVTMFPIVAKGRTSSDLQPPWRKLRWVKAGDPFEGADAMYQSARTIAAAMGIWGFFEVEFVLGNDVRVIEVNPRISGTLRLSAMAADIKIFGTGVLAAGPRILQPVLSGLELPFEGEHIVESGLIATSRLTCVRSSMTDVLREVSVRAPSYAKTLHEFDRGCG